MRTCGVLVLVAWAGTTFCIACAADLAGSADRVLQVAPAVLSARWIALLLKPTVRPKAATGRDWLSLAFTT